MRTDRCNLVGIEDRFAKLLNRRFGCDDLSSNRALLYRGIGSRLIVPQDYVLVARTLMPWFN